MRRRIFWIVALVVILAGLALIAGVLFAIKFDFRKLNTQTFARERRVLEGEFSEIEIRTDAFDVRILPMSGEDGAEAYLPYSEKVLHTLTVQDGKLLIEVEDTRAWYEKWSFNTSKREENSVLELRIPHACYDKLTVKVKSGDVLADGQTDEGDALCFGSVDLSANSGDVEFRASATENVRLQTSTGNITVGGVKNVPILAHATTGDISVIGCELTSAELTLSTGEVMLAGVNFIGEGILLIEVSSGDISMQNVKAQRIELKTTTGEIEMKAVTVAGELRAETTTGDIEIERSDAGSLYLKSTTGDVDAELISGKMFHVETTSGEKEYPASDRDGGVCEVKTTSGDVEIVVLAR